MKMKKPRLDNGDYMPYENGHNTGKNHTQKKTYYSPKNLISPKKENQQHPAIRPP
jgi:hypothetical protein